ncbi:MAG: hypothetical protein DWQ04_33085 [Chloroflexi bacterium]|nr:MAG: hypothetical protein DWQ04_33085 [Chloroflexota bacterium]
MRIDLFRGGKRPFPIRIALTLFKLRAGAYPGPPVAITYRPDLLTKDLGNYISRGMHGSGGWSKGEAEMFAAFTSSLNSCQF